MSFKSNAESAWRHSFVFIKAFFVSLLLFAFVPAAVDGNVDLSYTTGVQSPGYILTAATQSDGKILIGGYFSSVNGSAQKSLARLNPDGTMDETFNSPIEGEIQTIVVQNDDKILIGGGGAVINGVGRYGINRLNPDGSIDADFNAGNGVTGGNVLAVALQPDGKILIGGGFDRVNGLFRNGLARLNADGSVDTGFTTYVSGNDSNDLVRSIVVQPNGQIIIGGSFTNVVTTPKYRIARLNQNGTIDESFTASVTNGNRITDIELLPDGKMIVFGNFTQINAAAKRGIAKLNSDGAIDNTFTATLTNINYLPKGTIQSDGKIIVTGNIFQVNNVVKSNLARLNADGTLDDSFNGSANNTTSQALNDAGGNVLVFGFFNQLNGADRFSLGRLDSNGNIDPNFAASVGINGEVRKLLIDANGKTLVGGRFTHFGNVLRRNIARLNDDGSLDTSFNPGLGTDANSETKVYDIAVSNDSKIALAGNFLTFNGLNHRALVLLNADGSIVSGFNANFTANNVVTKVAFFPNGKILIVGSFILPGNSQFSNIALLNADGSRDTSFQPTFSGGNVTAMKIQSDGKILLGGTFTSVNGVPKSNIVRLNADGTVDNSLTLNTPNIITGIIYEFFVQPDGKILVSGGFNRTNVQFYTYLSLLRLNTDGSLDESFSIFNNANFYPPFAVQSDGRIIVFQSIREHGTNNYHYVVARLTTSGKIDHSFNTNRQGAKIEDVFFTLAVKPDNKVLLGGKFTSYDNIPRQSLVQLENSMLLPPMMFDYDGDGRADVSVFRPTNNVWYLSNSSSGFTAAQFGAAGDVLAPADFDGDGKTDMAVFRPSNGTWYWFNSSNNTLSVVGFGAEGDIPAPADYDGDGKADVSVFRPSNGVWYRLNSGSGNSFTINQFGSAEDKPAVGDYDGDGKADIAVYRPSNNVWYRLNSGSNNSFSAVQFGAAGDLIVPADYDGDGRTDFSIFRPSNGTWYRLNSSNDSFVGVGFGINGDKPAPADYDGDGKADFAVFRPSNGTWYLQRSQAGFTAQQFGAGEDVPTPAASVK